MATFLAVLTRRRFLVTVVPIAGIAERTGTGLGPSAALVWIRVCDRAEKHLVISLAVTISAGFAQALDF